MKAWELLGDTCAPDGTNIRLTRRDDEYMLLADGRPLMSSRMHGSEEALANSIRLKLRTVRSVAGVLCSCAAMRCFITCRRR